MPEELRSRSLLSFLRSLPLWLGPLVAAAAVRLWGLGSRSLWVDEAFAAGLVDRSFAEAGVEEPLNAYAKKDNTPMSINHKCGKNKIRGTSANNKSLVVEAMGAFVRYQSSQA